MNLLISFKEKIVTLSLFVNTVDDDAMTVTFIQNILQAYGMKD